MDIFANLKHEISLIKDKVPKITDDNAFLFWFLKAFLVGSDNDQDILNCIIGGTGDVNIDGYYVDRKNKKIFIIQSKYREKSTVTEKRNDIISFIDLENGLDDKVRLKTLLENANSNATSILKELHALYSKKAYDLNLIYVTTGTVAKKLKTEMVRTPKYSTLIVFENIAIKGLYNDYIEGVAPPIPYIDLPLENNNKISNYDKDTKITSMAFIVNTEDIKKIYNSYGVKLFARNIRGYLGGTNINDSIQETLEEYPEHFLYFNNGITIICDNFKPLNENGIDILRVENPQIINGQQTTRTISKTDTSLAKVLVRTIVIPKEDDNDITVFSDLVGQIVASTNWQNAIKASDLKSNDIEQIRIERELRRSQYHYLRKKMAKSEVNKQFADIFKFKVDKFNLIKSIASVVINPHAVRKGVEHLFEDEDIYHKIYNSKRNISEYIFFYWLHKSVKKMSNNERSYAMWYVINDVFSQVKEVYSKNILRKKLIEIFERGTTAQNSEILKVLLKVIDINFKFYVNDFFRYSKRLSKEPIELSTFFNNAKLAINYKKFFTKNIPKNKKVILGKTVNKFIKLIEDYDD